MSARIAAVRRPDGQHDVAEVTCDQLAALRTSGHLATVRRARARRTRP